MGGGMVTLPNSRSNILANQTVDAAQAGTRPPYTLPATTGASDLVGVHASWNSDGSGSPSPPPVPSKAWVVKPTQAPLGINSHGQTREQDAILPPQYGDVAQSNEQNRIPATMESTYPHTVLTPTPEHRNEAAVVNVVIFGETGVGKSSLINLIANEKLARTSNDAHGCTFRHEQHQIPLNNTLCTIWDTTGLDEGSEGTVPAKLAEHNLRELVHELTSAGGIHLIIYCVRGSRLTKALRRNYDLFYVTVCRKKVPVALVVTGLEHQEGEMEMWWTQNEASLRRNGMWFDAHACVTTLDVQDHVIQQRRSEAREQLCRLVVKYSGLPGWKADSSFISRVLPFFNAAVRAGTSSTGILGKTVRRVAVCGSPSCFLPATTVAWDKTTSRIGNKEFKFLRVDKDALHLGTSQILKHSIGVLLFYTSPLVDNRLLQTDFDALKGFYDTAGGHSCPMIVVLQGCDDERVAWACRSEISSRYCDIQPHVVPVPGAKLDEMIENLCIEQVEGVAQKLWKSIIG